MNEKKEDSWVYISSFKSSLQWRPINSRLRLIWYCLSVNLCSFLENQCRSWNGGSSAYHVFSLWWLKWENMVCHPWSQMDVSWIVTWCSKCLCSVAYLFKHPVTSLVNYPFNLSQIGFDVSSLANLNCQSFGIKHCAHEMCGTIRRRKSCEWHNESWLNLSK